MDATQADPLPPRPEWGIDRQLARLVGWHVRVGADSFSPPHWDGEFRCPMVQMKDLSLPDNRRPGRLPVYFEGRLRSFKRRIGVVFVTLEAPPSPERPADGIIPFRGNMAVVLRGPATVRLAFPFRVEPVPVDPGNYWEDVRTPGAQFVLPLAFPTGSDESGSPQMIWDLASVS